jgi:hypothetical protein
MKTTNIQVYGHRPGGDGFSSNKVLYFNREHLIKDEFSEVENQQQNVVESGGIRWLKSAIHVFLDMTGAPALK